tara:strand:+ start:704 stop:955 length:252 start_codon:yes stop_codon:yes gene_type:complete
MDKFDVKALADECFPVVGLAQMDGVTRAQMASLFRKWKQADQGLSWAEFTRTASGPHSMYSGAILAHWSGMTLCIEQDGHTHS